MLTIFRAVKEALVGPPKKVRIGRPANETDTYNRDREARRKAAVEQDKQEFQKWVGPMKDHTPLTVKPRGHSPNPSCVSLPSSHSAEPSAAGPSGLNTLGTAALMPQSVNTPAVDSATQTRSSQPAGYIPIHNLSDVKKSLGNVIGMMGRSGLKEEMKDLYDCCVVLTSLLEEIGAGSESSLEYTYALSTMHQDLNDIMRFLTDWSQKKLGVEAVRRKDIHIEVRMLQETFTRHLNVFIAIRQSEGAAIISQKFDELHAKLDAMKNHAHARVPTNPANIDQADADVLSRQVRDITGHTPNASYILKGDIDYRENVAVHVGMNFDVYRGKLKNGETVAIKLYREKLMNDGRGVRFVERILRQVQFWSSFNSPFILRCYGIGMQITPAAEGQEYDRFQFYLVSPFKKRGDAVQYIRKQRRVRAYVNVLQYVRHAALGVQYLHQGDPGSQYVHASIRGENVIIKDDDTACLNGFGLTKAFSVGKQIELTGKNFQCRWMAPELLNRDKPPLQPSCDIWSWAMTALELITGEEPYYKIESQWLVQDAIIKGQKPQRSDYPTFKEYCPQPDSMWELLEKCWATEAEARPTISQVVAELENIEKAQIEQQNTPHVWA